MELYNRAVVAAVCLVGGLAVGILGLTSILNRDARPPQSKTLESRNIGIDRQRVSSSATSAIALRTLELKRARKQVAELQRQLSDQTAALSEARRELHKLVAMNEKLLDERNQSLDWLLTLLDYEVSPPDESPNLPEQNDPAAEVVAQIDDWQMQIELETLRNELEISRGELAELNAARQLERVQADEAREQLEQSTAELLTRVGDEAVAALAEALEHPDADVRRLAAKTLRAFGGNGQAAIPALTMALADPDLRVREEAALALRAVRD